ncbi:hypothetical protein PISMIDRAFT_317081 [Pisolithus microcarpus 441]|uniref:Uncharacterized protein n=1 Tax=Pisolithus microcarpus 441 TaxID=765257 RepID=A0A0C9YM41_9AGAM|nr:hypothetical protein BKA83DRAFT_317081 [Pisolithus microcarpus]KIK26025.1 hypothetical protein PISMIDRAFT_317081 [Pisolithus microcarpus 441]
MHRAVSVNLLSLWRPHRSHFRDALQSPSPASIEVKTMPYPRTPPDPSVFEDLTDEYSSASTPVTPVFTPLSSTDTLAALVRKGDFRGAETLRQEMISHRIPITRDSLYQKAALNAIRERRPHLKPRHRIQAFQAWMSLVPDRQQQVCTFYAIRQHIFRSMDHLNMDVVHCFGLVLAAKGYFTNAGVLQVVATLAQYAAPSVTEAYLRALDTQCRTLSAASDGLSAETLMEAPFNLAVKKHSLARRTDAALRLLKIAHGRRIAISHDTLRAVLKHASSRQHALVEIRTLYPAFSNDLTPLYHSTLQHDTSAISDDFGHPSARLRALRKAFDSPVPPTPYVLLRFITDCCARGKFHTVTLLRKCAFRQSSRSAAAWVLSEMLYHRERKEHLRVLAAFARYFYFVGVPRESVLSLLRGSAGKSVHPHAKSFGFGIAHHVHLPPYPLKQRLRPSRSHTALVWEALVAVSRSHERKRLYALLLQLVEGAKRTDEAAERACSEDLLPSPDVAEGHPKPALELSLSSFDAAHFSPFIKAHVARGRPECATQVVADMVARGIQPSIVQWSMVARAYAQGGDAATALRILDQLEVAECGSGVDLPDTPDGVHGKTAEDETRQREVRGHMQQQPSDGLLGIFTNVLRGFVLAKDVEHARRVKLWLTERLGYQMGKRPATDAAIELLAVLEAEKT